jgi:hypothetical protein
MSVVHESDQMGLFDLPEQTVPAHIGQGGVAPMPLAPGYCGEDARAGRREEVLSETAGWSPASARDASGMTANEQAAMVEARRHTTPLTSEARTTAVERARRHLASLGLEPTDPYRRGRRW